MVRVSWGLRLGAVQGKIREIQNLMRRLHWKLEGVIVTMDKFTYHISHMMRGSMLWKIRSKCRGEMIENLVLDVELH